MTAETSNARGEWPARYACNGPEGAFWTDDAALANKLIAAAFDRDEWTVTDTQNPTAAAPQPPSAPSDDLPALLDNLMRAAFDDGDKGREKFSGATMAAREAVLAHVRVQQPAAVDEAMVDRAGQALYGTDWGSFEGWEADQLRRKVRAVLTAAIAQQPAAPRAASEQAITEALRREREELRYE